LRSLYRPCSYVFLPTVIIIISAVAAFAQSTGTSEDLPPVNPALAKIERARALAAAHQLQTASTELENVRASVTDVALKNVTSLMLIGIYLEEGNYGRAQALLDDSFQTRAAQKDESIRTYFAAAGQTVNGVRTHLARYRSFGINPSEPDLPAEANTDLDRVRTLVERVITQAKEISREEGRSYDALALLEDVLGIRLSIARNNEDRDKWQAEYVAARERMASSKTQIASIGRSPALDAMTAKIPNPFAKPADQTDPTAPETGGNTATGTTQPTGQPAGAAAAPTTQPALISTGSLAGRETKRITPSYPSLAKSTNIQGTVRVFAIIDENGKIWITNSEGPAMLRRAAEDAARGWSFPPTLVSGKPVRVAGYLDFEFRL
jgi:TonB family protein